MAGKKRTRKSAGEKKAWVRRWRAPKLRVIHKPAGSVVNLFEARGRKVPHFFATVLVMRGETVVAAVAHLEHQAIVLFQDLVTNPEEPLRTRAAAVMLLIRVARAHAVVSGKVCLAMANPRLARFLRRKGFPSLAVGEVLLVPGEL